MSQFNTVVKWVGVKISTLGRLEIDCGLSLNDYFVKGAFMVPIITTHLRLAVVDPIMVNFHLGKSLEK